ncbi:MAG: TIGR04282 family arsenosugar biosynthesis glycosyltransferase [Anaerolineales bacterium]|nr:MAG: TIGR04282 family arsenosugar biosynthesis glycosyltransferase [Anaerolineales bacterium]
MKEVQPNRVLMIVAKRPAPGHTKTRLTPPLTPWQAANLYEAFLRDSLELIRHLPEIKPVIAYLPEGAQTYFHTLAPEFDLLLQQGNDLGSRLDNALQHYLAGCHKAAVIMNSDSPTLPVEYLSAAFRILEDGADLVLGPCEDGGYYLIGLKRPAPRLLREVRMSTPTVTVDTLALAAQEGLRVTLLPQWYDVDDAASLQRLANELHNDGSLARHTRAALDALGI